MRRTMGHRWWLVFILAASLPACAGDRAAGPRARLGSAEPGAQFHPGGAFTAKLLFPGQYSVANAVNDLNQVAGALSGSAFRLDPGGALHMLPLNGATSATATDLSASGEVGGVVQRGGKPYPAVWTRPTSLPVELKQSGGVLAVNDRLEAVGYFDRGGFPQPMYWNVRTRAWQFLPVPAGTTQGSANDINNDRVIVGEVDGAGAMWTWSRGGFVFRRLSGIRAWGVDGGYGTVGNTASGQAAYGAPDFKGNFPTTGLAMAWRVNGWGVAVGEDWDLTTNTMQAWLGDPTGNFSYLPAVPGNATGFASARAINTCGLIVGFIGGGATQEAAMWDPGC